MADFGVLHRNEAAGALTGLTRVRRFVQDDAHIFCALSQVEAEIEGVLDFIDEVYVRKLNLSYHLALSTRPDTFLGEVARWDDAEAQLRRALDARGRDYAVKDGDGAFYGPKIDVTVVDSLRRRHQCATIQLDFQLPERFNLSFSTACAGHEERPVMIHRAVLGSVERFLALLAEHTRGKWPLWLSPRMVAVVPVSSDQQAYVNDVVARLRAAGLRADADLSSNTLNKKIRSAQLAQYNYVLVVGKEEMSKQTVNVRTRDNVVHGESPLEDFATRLQAELAGFL